MRAQSSDEMLVDSCFHYRKQSPCDVCGASARTAATPIARGPRGSPYTIAIDCERALNGSLPEHVTDILQVVRAGNLHLRAMKYRGGGYAILWSAHHYLHIEIQDQPGGTCRWPYWLVLLVRLRTFFELIRDLLGHPQFRDVRLLPGPLWSVT